MQQHNNKKLPNVRTAPRQTAEKAGRPIRLLSPRPQAPERSVHRRTRQRNPRRLSRWTTLPYAQRLRRRRVRLPEQRQGRPVGDLHARHGEKRTPLSLPGLQMEIFHARRCGPAVQVPNHTVAHPQRNVLTRLRLRPTSNSLRPTGLGPLSPSHALGENLAHL